MTSPAYNLSMLDNAAAPLLRSPIGFLLVPRFTVISLSSAIEPLRIANRYVSQKYAWRLVSADGRPVPDGNGIAIQADCSIEDAGRLGALFVCADHEPEKAATRRATAWLRGLDRAGVLLGGIDAGAFTLARAGLLEGRRAPVHGEVVDAFRERFPGTALPESLFEADRGRLTCAGGTAVLDMMLHAIAADHGQTVADRVAGHCLHDHIRQASELQHMARARQSQVRHPKLAKALRYAGQRLDRMLSPRDVAQAAGVSSRQLSRMFQAALGQSPGRYLLDQRLQRARQLLRRTDMPVLDIAVACGFASQAHFSRTYRRAWGPAPRDDRHEQELVRHRQTGSAATL